jgi:hypothetical protein
MIAVPNKGTLVMPEEEMMSMRNDYRYVIVAAPWTLVLLQSFLNNPGTNR